MAKDRDAAADKQGGGNPPPQEATAAVRKSRPLKRPDHDELARAVGVIALALEKIQKKVGTTYATSAEVCRATRETIRSFNRMRSSLNARFFSEGHSDDGTTLYFTKEIPVLKAEDE